MDVRTLRERIRNCRTEAHRVADMAADIERQDEFRPGSYGSTWAESRRLVRPQGGPGFYNTPVQGVRRAAERCASQLSEIERDLEDEGEWRPRSSFSGTDYGYGYTRGAAGPREPRDRERSFASRPWGTGVRGYATQYR